MLAIVAHEGGWDDVLLVAVPIAVIVAALVVAKRRVGRRSPATRDHSPDGNRPT